MNLYQKLIKSFDNEPGGFSARKASAFVAVVAASLPMTYKYTDSDNLADIILIWLGFALLCLGIVTAEQIVKIRQGKSITTTVKTETSQEKTVEEKVQEKKPIQTAKADE